MERTAARASMGSKVARLFLAQAPWVLLVVVCAAFGSLSPKFLTPENLVNILVQSSSCAVVAMGMTFVLLTSGIDLSVGCVMFLSAVIAGKMALAGAPVALAAVAIVLTGIACGSINALFVTRLGILPFIVTLSTAYLGRGLGLWISQTRAMNLPEGFLALGSARPLGVPAPIAIFAVVLLVSWYLLERTPVGRQIYAIGNDIEMARRAGIRTGAILAFVYVICGLFAAVGGLVSVAQLGAVSPTFGTNREFAAISAAVLGGTSLFGGRGRVFPGTVLGAILIQTVESGLVIVKADPYLNPLVLALIIFFSVLVDSFRHERLRLLGRRKIRPVNEE